VEQEAIGGIGREGQWRTLNGGLCKGRAVRRDWQRGVEMENTKWRLCSTLEGLVERGGGH
ncbi:unnamed protein product, partial [Staurois parvus]